VNAIRSVRADSIALTGSGAHERALSAVTVFVTRYGAQVMQEL
jgi:hypothetical protein